MQRPDASASSESTTEAQPAAENATVTQKNGRRQAARKVLRRAASLALSERPALKAKTLELSREGLALLIGQPLRPGLSCVVQFDVCVDGKFKGVAVKAKVTYCALAGAAGFRVGCEGTAADPASAKAIDEFMNAY